MSQTPCEFTAPAKIISSSCGKCSLDIKWYLLAHYVIACARQLMRTTLGRHNGIRFLALALIEPFNRRVITPSEIRCLHIGPPQILVAIFGVAPAFPFAIAQFLTAHAATIRGILPDLFEAADITRFQPDGQRQDLANPRHAQQQFKS